MAQGKHDKDAGNGNAKQKQKQERKNGQRITIRDIIEKKSRHERISIVTSYDYALASMCDMGGVDMLMVGDSAGMVMLGYKNTIPVTMNEMCVFVGAVSRARKRAAIVADMPFMSYQPSTRDAIKNAGRLIRAGSDAVKIEGGVEVAPKIKAIVDAGIPVMGHIGLQPQTASLADGYRVQGKTAADAKRLFEDAIALQEAGVFAIVLEMVAYEAAELITQRTKVPTIGIGAGAGCDGQVLVIHDMLGMYDMIKPKFAKRYCNLSNVIIKAVSSYVQDVTHGKFPTNENRFAMDTGEYKTLDGMMRTMADFVARGGKKDRVDQKTNDSNNNNNNTNNSRRA